MIYKIVDRSRGTVEEGRVAFGLYIEMLFGEEIKWINSFMLKLSTREVVSNSIF